MPAPAAAGLRASVELNNGTSLRSDCQAVMVAVEGTHQAWVNDGFKGYMKYTKRDIYLYINTYINICAYINVYVYVYVYVNVYVYVYV